MAGSPVNASKATASPLIRRNLLEDARPGNGLHRILVVFLAVGISLIVHAGAFGGFSLLQGPSNGRDVPLESVKRNKTEDTNVQPQQQEKEMVEQPLTVQDVDPKALDPDTDLGYKSANEREAEVKVPGIVNQDVPIGIEGGSVTSPPTDLPAPPGFGSIGLGGGLDLPGLPGTGASDLAPGGYSKDGSMLPEDAFGGARASGATKEKALNEGGGSKETEAAVTKGLLWLKKVQSPDGAWRLDGPFPNPGKSNDIAGTAFGLLPFLGAGHVHNPTPEKMAEDKHGFSQRVHLGLSFLIRNQNPTTGEFTKDMYAHALATYALCEAYGMSADPKLKVPAQKAVNFLIYAQHAAGGWRYGPGQDGDLSVTGWCLQAMKAAKMAKLYVPEKNWKYAVKFVDNCESNDGYSYQPGGGPSSTMSAVGLLGRYFLQNWGPNNLNFINGIQKHIKTVPPGVQKNMYYYYYATQVMYQYGGKDWKEWNGKMTGILLHKDPKMGGQNPDGSWTPVGAHADVGGRLMETSLSILTLEVYYRYLPTYFREKGYRQDNVSVGS